jgi:hypothetical protein
MGQSLDYPQANGNVYLGRFPLEPDGSLRQMSLVRRPAHHNATEREGAPHSNSSRVGSGIEHLRTHLQHGQLAGVEHHIFRGPLFKRAQRTAS